MKKVIVLLSFSLLLACIASGQSVYQRIYFEASPEQIQSLISEGVTLDHLLRKDNGFIAEISEKEVTMMKNAGVKVNIITADLSADFKLKYGSFNGFSDTRDFTIPEHFHAGSMGGVLTLSEVWSELDSMRFYFPDLISEKDSIGTSYEGRTIYMVRISDHPDEDEGEPEIEFDAIHHANEGVGMMHLIYYMWWLLENYEEDSLAHYLVNEREIYFVPVVNPDGYYYNESVYPGGGGYWRKNMRDNGDGNWGVDLNRNYSYEWGHDSGSSGDTWHGNYRGTAPFSEPETQAMRDFTIAHNFINAASCHTFGDFLIYPWGYTSDACSDADWFSAFSERATRWSDYEYGTAMQLLGYLTSGTSHDFHYGDTLLKPRSMAFIPETGYSFWPDPNDIPEMCGKVLDENILFTYLPNAIFTISADDEITTGTINFDVPFTVSNVGLQQGTVNCYLQTNSPYIVNDGDTVIINNADVLATAASVIPVQWDENTPDGTHIDVLLLADDGLIKDSAWVNIEYTGVSGQTSPDHSQTILPNPASDYIRLEGPWHDVVIFFFDVTARTMQTSYPLPNAAIDISFLSPGIYYLEARSPHGNYRFKLVKN